MTIAPLTPGPRHPWELLLAQLTGLSGLVHGWGDEDDAKRAPSSKHVTWVPGTPSNEARPFGLAAGVVESVLVLPHIVSIYGGSPLEAVQRALDLLGQLPLLLGPRQGNLDATPPQPGWDTRSPGKPIKGGELAGGAWLIQLTVTLKLFVYSQIYGAALVQGFTVTAQAKNPDGSTETGVVATS